MHPAPQSNLSPVRLHGHLMSDVVFSANLHGGLPDLQVFWVSGCFPFWYGHQEVFACVGKLMAMIANQYSSHAWAKEALTNFRISLDRRSSFISLQAFDVAAFFAGNALSQSCVDVLLRNSLMQCFRGTADLRCGHANGGQQGWLFASLELQHTHS